MKIHFAGSLILAVGCGGPSSIAGHAPVSAGGDSSTSRRAVAAATVAAAERVESTPSGTTFTAPATWTTERKDSALILEDPEKDFTVAVVDVPNATNAEDAVKQAWPLLVPGFSTPLRLSINLPNRNGWQATSVYQYQTSPLEKKELSATVYRRGNAWCVVLQTGSEAASGRRGGEIGLILGSLKPAGYIPETFAGKRAHRLDAARIKVLTDFVRDGQKQLNVPGVAISLIDDGKVVFAGGFGVRELGKPEPVDAKTLFMIASNTKALTTLLLAREVDLGKFTWDTPVTQVYPAFKLGDPEATRRIVMKQLVCACTGIPRKDFELLFEYEKFTPEGVIGLLGTSKPTSKFGEVFQYSNVMAAAAGYIGGHAMYPGKELGAAYDEAMQNEVFTPLGMNATTFDSKRALSEDHASPHSEAVDGNLVVASMMVNNEAPFDRPAGGAWSNVNDVARYVLMELSKGKLPDGKRYVSEAALLQRRVPQVANGDNASYGMGLEIERKHGVDVVHHGGSWVGYKSDMMWLPSAGVGAVIMANSDRGGLLLQPFMQRLLEVLYEGEPQAERDVAQWREVVDAAHKSLRAELVIPADGSAVAGLAAHYWNASLGSLDVTKVGSETLFDCGEWKSRVASRKNNDGTTSFVLIEPGLLGLPFLVAERDGKKALVLDDGQHEYVFLETGK